MRCFHQLISCTLSIAVGLMHLNLAKDPKMMIIIFLMCCLASGCLQQEVNETAPIVETIYGKVRGTIMTSRRGRSFSAFRGIPYAKPPIGTLRFKAPQEPESWTDVKNATEDADMCIQQNYLFAQFPEIEGSEDCLYINVYTPVGKSKLENPREEDPLPVIVFIHYGAFIGGSSSSDVLGPEYLMDKDVLLVTFNYRLGIFGFLSTYDDAAPGNWAFKDQVAALRWVHNNIEEFGGNPERVTIAGQSAGAGSVHHHILSPQSRGLFQAAITQSGSALALWAQPQRAISLIVAKVQADMVGCNSSVSTSQMVDCLREIPAATLVNSMNLFRFMRSEPLTMYLPAIEFETENNPSPFITEEPLKIIQNREFNNVPWIIGVTPDEGILRAAPFTRQTDLLEAINKNFDTYFVEMLYLGLSVSSQQIPATWSKIKEFYFSNESSIDVSNARSVQGLINVYSDRGFLFPAYQTSLLHRHNGHDDVWFYYFDYRGNQSYGEKFAAVENEIDFEWGVSHCDDLLYLFKSPKLFPNFELSNNDLEMSDFMVELFTNFATYLNPTPELFLDSWKQLPNTENKQTIENSDLVYLKLSGSYSTSINESFDVSMVESYHPERMSFWIGLPLNENVDNLS